MLLGQLLIPHPPYPSTLPTNAAPINRLDPDIGRPDTAAAVTAANQKPPQHSARDARKSGMWRPRSAAAVLAAAGEDAGPWRPTSERCRGGVHGNKPDSLMGGYSAYKLSLYTGTL